MYDKSLGGVHRSAAARSSVGPFGHDRGGRATEHHPGEAAGATSCSPSTVAAVRGGNEPSGPTRCARRTPCPRSAGWMGPERTGRSSAIGQPRSWTRTANPVPGRPRPEALTVTFRGRGSGETKVITSGRGVRRAILYQGRVRCGTWPDRLQVSVHEFPNLFFCLHEHTTRPRMDAHRTSSHQVPRNSSARSRIAQGPSGPPGSKKYLSSGSATSGQALGAPGCPRETRGQEGIM